MYFFVNKWRAHYMKQSITESKKEFVRGGFSSRNKNAPETEEASGDEIAYLSQTFKSFRNSILQWKITMPKTKNKPHTMAKIYTALNKEKGGSQLYYLSSQLNHFCENDQIEFSNFAENKIFYSILKYFVAKKNSLCYNDYI